MSLKKVSYDGGLRGNIQDNDLSYILEALDTISSLERSSRRDRRLTRPGYYIVPLGSVPYRNGERQERREISRIPFAYRGECPASLFDIAEAGESAWIIASKLGKTVGPYAKKGAKKSVELGKKVADGVRSLAQKLKRKIYRKDEYPKFIYPPNSEGSTTLAETV